MNSIYSINFYTKQGTSKDFAVEFSFIKLSVQPQTGLVRAIRVIPDVKHVIPSIRSTPRNASLSPGVGLETRKMILFGGVCAALG